MIRRPPISPLFPYTTLFQSSSPLENTRCPPLRSTTNYARRSRACPESRLSGRADHFCAPCPHSALQRARQGGRLRVPHLRLRELGGHSRPAGRPLRPDPEPQDPHPARSATAGLRPPAPAGGEVLAGQHLPARRQPLPVLREEVLVVRAVARPRHPDFARREVELGEI